MGLDHLATEWRYAVREDFSSNVISLSNERQMFAAVFIKQIVRQ